MQPTEEFDSLISEDASSHSPAGSLEPFQSIENHSQSEKINFPRFFKAIHTLERRRQSMSLDAAYYYLRHLELKLQSPDLYKVCNSIKTVDAVLADKQGRADIMRNFTDSAWQKVKERLFQVLLTTYPGRFIVYSVTAKSPLTPGKEWSENGFVDFYPEKQTRPDEFYSLPLKSLTQANCAVLKRAFLEAKLSIKPEDFVGNEVTDERSAASSLMRIYDICEQEAETGKSKANSVKNGLEAELRRCTDRQRRKEIRRHLLKLQTIWGGVSV
jgi:hypothetical protein